MKNIYQDSRLEVWLDDAWGNRLLLIDFMLDLSYARSFGSVGRFSMTLPLTGLDLRLIKAYHSVEIWRMPVTGKPSLEFAGVILTLVYSERDGEDIVTLKGADGNFFLRETIVAFTSDSAEAQKTDYADDMMKAFFNENRIARHSGTYLQFFKEQDLSYGPSVTIKAPWKNLLSIFNELSDISIYNEQPIYFDMVPDLATYKSGLYGAGVVLRWKFRTARDQLGADRTYASAVPVVFSKEFGNLENPVLTYDYDDEVTSVYVGGDGEGADREVLNVVSATRYNVSPWSLREKFVSYSTMESTASLTDRGSRAIQDGEPRITFSANLKDSPQTRYGIDWFYGDRIVAKYRDVQVEAVIDAIAVSLTANGEQQIRARMNGTL